MNQVTRLERALKALTLLFLTMAAGTFLWRPSLPTAEKPVSGLDTAATRSLAALDPQVGPAIVAANIFSARRAPPATRYRPYLSEAESAPAPAPRVAAADADGGTGEDRVPQLFGIVLGPAGATALLRLDPGASGALIYREGDQGGAFQVVKIEERSVVLKGPKGQIVLRLNRPQGETR